MSGNNFKFRHNKKAQTAETMTWVIATLIIIFVLLVSIFLSSQVAKAKKTINYAQTLNKNKIFKNDLLMQESVFTYFMISKDKKNLVYNKLELLDKQDEFHNDFKNKIEQVNKNLKN